MTIIVIGGGSIGQRHAKNLLHLGQQIAMVEVNSERRSAVEQELGVSAYATFDAALADTKFASAFVCSPSIYHLEQARQCAEAGLDLFIEKPLSHSLLHISDFLEAVKQKQLVTMVGSNWKFYPLFQIMKKLLDEGAIGRILSARCQFGSYLPDWHPWEDYRQGYSANKKLGGGILLDSHEFDYLTWFVGKKVKRIACFAGHVTSLEIDVEDIAEAIVQFDDGAIGEIHQDYIQRFSQRNFEFFGSLGSLFWDINSKKIVVHSILDKGRKTEEYPLVENYDLNTMYIEEARHFLECVQKRQETITPIEAGAEVLQLICAAKESAETGRVIELD